MASAPQISAWTSCLLLRTQNKQSVILYCSPYFWFNSQSLAAAKTSFSFISFAVRLFSKDSPWKLIRPDVLVLPPPPNNVSNKPSFFNDDKLRRWPLPRFSCRHHEFQLRPRRDYVFLSETHVSLRYLFEASHHDIPQQHRSNLPNCSFTFLKVKIGKDKRNSARGPSHTLLIFLTFFGMCTQRVKAFQAVMHKAVWQRKKTTYWSAALGATVGRVVPFQAGAGAIEGPF